MVTNGPLVDRKPGRRAPSGDGEFHRPSIIPGSCATVQGPRGGRRKRTQLSISPLYRRASSWVAARVTAVKQAGEPDIQGHTNPLYLLPGRPVSYPAPDSRWRKWKAEVDWYSPRFSSGPKPRAAGSSSERQKLSAEPMRRF
jgi:hypothetical protein